ncbi:uncharacterized protein BDFB_006557 [Asbolus verrucosus]|uniref:Uncharacterized protein n=1 Tax=Asbolus verrucosus TaxID=1661398 RepID=A0A482W5P0_ASBVE|nr:uncharacterized protein BDFB_006557 [Asbolus verrucosus]
MIFLYIAATTDGKSTKKSKDELVILNKKLIGKLKPIPSQNHKSQSLNQYYQPGTTLYSTLNGQGQVGSLSSHLPQQPYSNEPHVPVIILRVYPSQLNDPGSQPHTQTKTIQVAIPAHTYSAVQVETPVMQYGYTSQDDGASQGYYYQQSGEPAQSYYYQSVPEPGYQQVEQQYAQPEPNVQNNHHTHQKRSKKARFARIRLQAETPNDVIKLEPIKA